MSCDKSQQKFIGDGAAVLFEFSFEYEKQTDVVVSLWDQATLRYVPTTEYTFENATTIRFNTAPPANPDLEENILIARVTNVAEMIAVFYPGSSIRAQDLNDDFEQLRMAIEEGQCGREELYDYINGFFWNKTDETIYTNDRWVADDNHVASTGAIDHHINDSILINWSNRAVTRQQQIEGNAIINDEHLFTTSAAAARHDTYHQASTPTPVPVEQPGKQWFDTATLDNYYWDANAGAWVDMGNAGPAGPAGDFGPPGRVIVGDNPPTEYPAVGDNQARPLESGDLWYNSILARLYIWYVDNTGGQWVSVSITGPQGPAGPDGQPGPGGGIPEAPLDGEIYGRQNGNWVTGVVTGANLMEPLQLTAGGQVQINLQILNAIL